MSKTCNNYYEMFKQATVYDMLNQASDLSNYKQ